MSKSITEQIADLQSENERLKELQKIIDKAIKNEFGIDTKKIHKIIENQNDFETKISSYFGLKTSADYDDFLSIFCTESSLNYYNTKRNNDNVSDAKKQG